MMRWLREYFRYSHSKHPPPLADVEMLQARDAEDRMAGLEQFLTFALGVREAGFGEPAQRLGASLPTPLERFYRFAGRWPSPHPDRSPIMYESPEERFFYAGIQHTHLAALDGVSAAGTDSIAIFSEQSGNWTGTTARSGADPPVWIKGAVVNGDTREPVHSGETLSGWLVAHCLAALAWETANSTCCATVERSQSKGAPKPGLGTWFEREHGDAIHVWSSRQTICPELSGDFYLLRAGILAHACGNLVRLAALTREAATELQKHASSSDEVE